MVPFLLIVSGPVGGRPTILISPLAGTAPCTGALRACVSRLDNGTVASSDHDRGMT